LLHINRLHGRLRPLSQLQGMVPYVKFISNTVPTSGVPVPVPT
jgi:hypothetical protein